MGNNNINDKNVFGTLDTLNVQYFPLLILNKGKKKKKKLDIQTSYHKNEQALSKTFKKFF